MSSHVNEDGQKWVSQVALDGVSVKEFWPDINRAVFHPKY